MNRHAAITIVSKNYLAFARTLADSYKRHHPDHDFLVILVDKADGLVPLRLDNGAEVVEIAAFQVPDLPQMIYRYSIMELNTAVKPFVLDDLFRRFGYDTLLYIDPDIWVFQPLEAVHTALTRASVVLTPHMRRPCYDDKTPSDTAILQSGTYNLGFIGLKRGATSARLLDWWKTKLFEDCIVDIPNGLFVDQKWIDLVPGFFPNHEVVYHPGYNAAYWNLHERAITRNGDQWRADGQALVFFHFSGYLPYAPDRLSKHQNRHVLNDLPDLKALTSAYAAALHDHGYAQSCRWPYAFATLPNGVRLPLDLVACSVRWAVRHDIRLPCPVTEPDAFCRLLMQRGLVEDQPRLVLLFHCLLDLRPDVAAAFAGCRTDHDHPGFRAWIHSSGIREYQLAALLPFETTAPSLPDTDAMAQLLVRTGKPGGGGLDAGQSQRLDAAWPGVHQILHLYFLRADLQREFADLHTQASRDGYVHWLRRHRHTLGLDEDAIALFAAHAAREGDLLGRASFLYRHDGQPRRLQPGLAQLEARRQECNCPLSAPALADWLLQEPALAEPSSVQAATSATQVQVNLAGFLHAPSGMGESARSMAATLAAAGAACHATALPHARALKAGPPRGPLLFGWPAAQAQVSIAVANADSAGLLESFLPPSFWAARSVGYWVWETERLPAPLASAQRLFDEIWTPSRYAADAIRQVVDRPVRVLPHVLDLPAIDAARADRAGFGLPADALLLGFAFDPASVLERKNLVGLIEAFEAAFRRNDNCWLVLKVNDTGHRSYAFHDALCRVRSGRVLVADRVLDRTGTFSFMKSLDAYVSLHRAEGFGLTCAEAMACGLPVVASGYSGNLDFMSDDNSLLVRTSVVQTDRPHGPYPAGTRWGQPDHDAAVHALRALKSASLRLQLGAAGQTAVRHALAPATVGLLMQTLLARLSTSPPSATPVSRLAASH